MTLRNTRLNTLMDTRQNMLILGGKSGLGEFMAKEFARLNSEVTNLGVNAYRVLALGKPDIDFASGWVTPVYDAVTREFGDPNNVNVIVITVFDNSHVEKADVQERVLSTIWKLYHNNPRTAVVVVGGASHYYTDKGIAKAKRSLAEQCRRIASVETPARLILLEPFYIDKTETSGGRPLTYFGLCLILKRLLDLELPYLQLTLKGSDSKTVSRHIPTTTTENFEGTRP